MQYFFAGTTVILMMVVIFCFSAENATESSSLSSGACRAILLFLERIFPGTFSAETLLQSIAVIETPVRKCAHFAEYAVLSVCVNHYLWVCFKLMKMDLNLPHRIEAAPERDSFMALEAESTAEPEDRANSVCYVKSVCRDIVLRAEIFCVAYAMSDELHQYFVPGRACRLFDVCVDSAGALFGAAVFWMFLKFFSKKKGNLPEIFEKR